MVATGLLVALWKDHYWYLRVGLVGVVAIVVVVEVTACLPAGMLDVRSWLSFVSGRE